MKGYEKDFMLTENQKAQLKALAEKLIGDNTFTENYI